VLAHADHQVRLLSRTTGETRATSPFEGELQKGMLVAGDRVFLTLRMPREKGKAVHDLLRAVSVENLSPMWEYVDVGMFLGQPATDGTALLITDSNGEVVLFR
jgi:putative exporter of polyketide antibiotics